MAVREELKKLDLKKLLESNPQLIPQSDTLDIKLVNENTSKSRYFVVESFNAYQLTANRSGGSYMQMRPINKNSVITISEKELEQNDYKDALNSGKLIKIDNVKVKSLIDAQIGKCQESIQLVNTMEYNPCRKVKKGQEIDGWINPINQDFKPLSINLYPVLKKGEYEVISNENKTKNNLVNGLFLVAGLFIVYKVLKTSKIL
jgi:hypothetical protein